LLLVIWFADGVGAVEHSLGVFPGKGLCMTLQAASNVSSASGLDMVDIWPVRS
jgi:hypothetical protein